MVYWKQYFERYPAVEYITDIDQDTCYILQQDTGKHHEAKTDENAWKRSVAQKSKRVFRRT